MQIVIFLAWKVVFDRHPKELISQLQKMAHYGEGRVKQINAQLIKLKSQLKNKAGATLRMTKKNFEDEELSLELLKDKKIN